MHCAPDQVRGFMHPTPGAAQLPAGARSPGWEQANNIPKSSAPDTLEFKGVFKVDATRINDDED